MQHLRVFCLPEKLFGNGPDFRPLATSATPERLWIAEPNRYVVLGRTAICKGAYNDGKLALDLYYIATLEHLMLPNAKCSRAGRKAIENG